MSERLLILGCSQRKLTQRAYWRRGGDMPVVLILSAACGLIDGGKPIPDYDLRMTPSAARRWIASRKQAEILQGRLHRADDCLVVAGKDYVRVIDALAALARIQDPSVHAYRVAEGGIGVKLGILKRWLEEMT